MGKRSKKKSKSSKCKEESSLSCCDIQNACNFSGLTAVLSAGAGVGTTGQLTVSGLNGSTNPSIKGCSACPSTRRCAFGACNQTQVNSVSVTLAGITTPLAFSSILQNSGGLFVATLLLPSPIPVGTPFAVTVSNPLVPCSGTVVGTTV